MKINNTAEALTFSGFGLAPQATQHPVGISMNSIHPDSIDLCAGIQSASCHLEVDTHTKLQHCICRLTQHVCSMQKVCGFPIK